MRDGVAETVVTIIVFGILIGMTRNYYLLIPMLALVLLFCGFNGG